MEVRRFQRIIVIICIVTIYIVSYGRCLDREFATVEPEMERDSDCDEKCVDDSETECFQSLSEQAYHDWHSPCWGNCMNVSKVDMKVCTCLDACPNATLSLNETMRSLFLNGSHELAPYCTKDGLWYWDECSMKCEDVEAVETNVCKCKIDCHERHEFAEEGEEDYYNTCGVDGKIYINKCSMDCHGIEKAESWHECPGGDVYTRYPADVARIRNMDFSHIRDNKDWWAEVHRCNNFESLEWVDDNFATKACCREVGTRCMFYGFDGYCMDMLQTDATRETYLPKMIECCAKHNASVESWTFSPRGQRDCYNLETFDP